MFPAQSLQAKGRIERLWNTLQSRLPVEFALADINNIKDANELLESYIPKFNKQFGTDVNASTN